MMTSLDRLITIGFVPCGTWSLDAAKPRCTLTDHANARNVLYAFVRNGEVLYVGKTRQPLRERMRGYQNPALTQSTNIRGNAKIVDLVREGGPVDVYAFPDNGLLHYGGFHLNLAAGLEDSIVSGLKPPWNMMGSR
jgi:hypothetical protein